MPAEWASPTVFTTRRTTAALSASASRTTPRPLPPTPSPLGGNARDRVAMAVLTNFWFWRTRAAATVAVLGPGRPNPGSVVQSVWHHRYHRSLPYWRFQMESHRA